METFSASNKTPRSVYLKLEILRATFQRGLKFIFFYGEGVGALESRLFGSFFNDAGIIILP